VTNGLAFLHIIVNYGCKSFITPNTKLTGLGYEDTKLIDWQ